MAGPAVSLAPRARFQWPGYVLALVTGATILAAADSANAQSSTFTATPASANFADSGDWTGGVVPGADGTTTNAGTATFNQTNTTSFGLAASPLLIDAGRNLENITFDTAAASPYVIGTTGGNALLLTSGGTIQTTTTVANVETVNAPLTLEPASSTTAGTYTIFSNATNVAAVLNIGGAITLGTTTAADTLTFSGSNTGANTFAGTLSDTGSGGLNLNFSGAGSWTYGGTGVSTLAKGTIVVSDSTFNFGAAGGGNSPSLSTTNSISGGGTGLLVNGNKSVFNMVSGSLTIGDATYGLLFTGQGGQTFNQTGGSISTNGLIGFSDSSASYTTSVNISGGTLTTTRSDSNAFTLATRGFTTATLSGTAVITTPIFNMTTSQIPAGSSSTGGSVFNLGNGTAGGTLITNQIIPGTGSAGTTFNFNGGTLQASTNNTASFFINGLTNAFVLAAGANVNTNGFSDLVGQNLLTSTTSTGGGLTKFGAGTLTLAGINTYTGPTLVSAGTLQIGFGGTTETLSPSSTITDNGTLAFDRANTAVQGTDFSGAPITGTGGLTQLGAGGTLILTAANTYAGATLISAGTLQIGNGGTAGSLAPTSTITDSGALVFNRSNTVTQGTDFGAGAITGTGSLTQAGTGNLILNAADTYSGATTISAGILTIASAGSLGTSGTYAGAISNAGAFNENSSANQILSGNITGAGSLSKGGAYTISSVSANLGNNQTAGTLTLSGTDSYTGATTANVGTLQLTGTLSGTPGVTVNDNAAFIDGSSTAATNNSVTDRINNAATLTLGGTGGAGTFTEAFGATGTTSQTLASLNLGVGGNAINTANTAAGTLNLIFTGTGGTGYLRSTGGVVNFFSATGFNPSFTNAPTAAGGSSVVGTSAPILVGATLNNNDFVSAASGTLVAPTYTASGATSLTTDANINVTAQNTTLAGGSTVSVNSLRFPDSTARTLALGTGSTLTVASGGILLPASVTTDNVNHTISGGSITSGVGDLIINASSGTPGTSGRSGLTNGNVRQASYALTIGSNIVNGTGPAANLALTVTGDSGAGGGAQILLSGANTYSGGTFLDGGFVSVNADSGLGAAAGTVTAVSGTNAITPTASFSFNSSRNFVINAGALLEIGDRNFLTTTIPGTLSGSGIFEAGFISQGQRVILTGNNSGFTGAYQVNGLLQATEGTGLSTSANVTFAGRNNLGLGLLETSGTFSRALGSGADQVQWASAGSGYSDGGFSAVGGALAVNLGGAGATLTQNVGGFLSGNAFLDLQSSASTNTAAFQNPINNNAAVLTVFVNSSTVGGTTAASTAATMSGAISGTGGFTKLGTGTLALTGTNLYTGATTVSAGTLLVGANGAATGAVTVAAGATLGGSGATSTTVVNNTGTIGGQTTVNGTITGATSTTIGMLTLTNTSTTALNSGSIYLVAINSTISDNLKLSGGLNIVSGADLTFTGTTGAATYDLANYTSETGTFTVTNLPSGYTLSYGATELDLVSTAVPEPSTWAAGLLCFGMLGFKRRRLSTLLGWAGVQSMS